jgi:hypothetical protein
MSSTIIAVDLPEVYFSGRGDIFEKFVQNMYRNPKFVSLHSATWLFHNTQVAYPFARQSSQRYTRPTARAYQVSDDYGK